MDDQTTFLVLMGLCCWVGLVLSLFGGKRNIIERKIPESEMAQYLVKPCGHWPKEVEGRKSNHVD